MTDKLYDLDSYITEFDAKVLECRVTKNGYGLILDRTAFFPEGGGQASDTGIINGFRVTDVHIKDDEIIHNIVSDEITRSLESDNVKESNSTPDNIFLPGTTVHGTVDWSKRFERMQQHSGEHLLSGCVSRHFGYHNTGFHLSDNGTTVDFDGTFTDDDLNMIENEVNGIILMNVPSHIYFPSPEELKQLSYRSKKELEGPVRIVEFGGYDRCACCAPHVKSTIEIGLFKILSAEHFKGGTRMEIGCGQRLLEELRLLQKNVRTISRLLSVKPYETAQGVEKLYESFKALKFNNVRIERELLEMTASHTVEPVLFLESADTANVRLAVNSLTARFPGRYCCAFIGNDEKAFNFIIASSASSDSQGCNCTELLQSMKAELHASGGGSSTMIQGNIKAAKAEIEAFLKTV